MRPRDDLEGLEPLEAEVPDLVDRGEAAAAEQPEDLVTAFEQPGDLPAPVVDGLHPPYFAPAFAFAKSPARTTEIFAASIHFRNAAPACSAVRAPTFFSSSASQASVRPLKRCRWRRTASSPSCDRLTCCPWSHPTCAAAVSSAVKPSLRARSISSRTAVSSFAVFCGAWIA